MSKYESTAAFGKRLEQTKVILSKTGHTALASVIDLRSDKSQDTTPLVFVPSVLGDPKTLPTRLGAALNTFAENGRQLVIINHSKQNLYRKTDTSPIQQLDLPKRELGRAAALLTVFDELDIQQADVVAQCEGAVNSSAFAFGQPERVRSLVLVNPSGIGQGALSQHVKYFATRTGRSLRQGLRASHRPNTGGTRNAQPLLHFGSNPLFRIPNLNATANSRIDPLFTDIEDAGVRVGVVKGSTDRLYPPALAEEHIGATTISGYELMPDPRSGHDPLINLPVQTAQLVLSMQREMLGQD